MTHILLAIIYIAFISLGLPDSLLGSAWPSIYPELCVPVSYAGIISAIISLGTVISSLQGDRMTLRFGTGRVTAASVAITAAALLGFSVSHSFVSLCIWAVPYGLGAGSVDASLNNYVALHFESRHMSWLHCMWGLGATIGPYVMGFALTASWGWNVGYRIIGVFQLLLTAVLIFSLPIWQKRTAAGDKEEPNRKALSLREIIDIPGAKAVMASFFCYSMLEQTTGLWAASYLTLYKGIPAQTAAGFASMFYIGITIGRAFSGFITMRLNDEQMVKMGQGIAAAGVVAMLLPAPAPAALAGLILIGLGCAPIYPCMIHATPAQFGADRSQAIIGVQMASAYVGTCAMPPLFGILASRISIALFPVYLFAALLLMAYAFHSLMKNGKSAV